MSLGTRRARRLQDRRSGPMFGAMLGIALVLISGRAEGFPWSTDMFRGQAVRPLSITPRNQPAGTLPENALRPMSREEAGRLLHNPLTLGQVDMTKTRLLFLTDCAPCHDANGTGRGPVRDVLRKAPFDLTSDTVRKLSDGEILWTILNGYKEMPPYGDMLSVQEAWEVVTYVRHLQRGNGTVHR